jgi:Cyclin, N-terminal domain
MTQGLLQLNGGAWGCSRQGWLHLLYLTCVYIAAKAVHYVPRSRMLALVISHTMRIPFKCVERCHTEAVEIDVLETLEWRLSPHLCSSEFPTNSSATVACLLNRLASQSPGHDLQAC